MHLPVLGLMRGWVSDVWCSCVRRLVEDSDRVGLEMGRGGWVGGALLLCSVHLSALVALFVRVFRIFEAELCIACFLPVGLVGRLHAGPGLGNGIGIQSRFIHLVSPLVGLCWCAVVSRL